AAGSGLGAAGLLSGGGITREPGLGKLHGLLGAGLTNLELRRLVELYMCAQLR
ncbi:asparaginase, partial [Pseudomonas syringae pv. tagetis]